MKKRIIALSAAILMILLCMAGCSSANIPSTSKNIEMSYDLAGAADTPMDNSKAAEYESDSYDYGENPVAVTGSGIYSNRKIIRNASLYVQTMEFESSVENMQGLVEEMGGYISRANVYIYNSYYSLRSANYTVRIPSDKFDSFISQRSKLGSVTSTNYWEDDVTDSYYDIEARLESLETKRVRLLELLEKAENMDNIIALESELSNTIYEIESLTGTLRRLDDQISYSTIEISLEEVRETTEPVNLPKTLGERISQKFTETINGIENAGKEFLIWIVGVSPVIILLLLIVIIIMVIVRATRPSRIRRREANAVKNAEAIAKWRENQNKPADNNIATKNDDKD